MNIINNKRSTLYFFLLMLILISIISHTSWFKISSNLFYGDWRLVNDIAAGQYKEYLGRSAWIGFYNFGEQNIQNNTFFIGYLIGLISYFNLSSKITFFWPIAILSLISPFLLSYNLFNNKKVAFLVSLFYGFSSYIILRSTSHLNIAVAYSLAPLVFLFFILFLKKPSFKNALFFSFSFCAIIMYELRISYIMIFVIIVYFLMFYLKPNYLKRNSKYFALVIFLLILFNSYWLLPLLSGEKSAYETILSRSLWGSNLFTYSRAITFMDPKWTGDTPINFAEAQPIKIYFWFFPFFSFFSFLFFNKLTRTEKKYLLFFGILSGIGVLLSKQTSSPFSFLYPFLFENFPFFKAFREASKFYIFIAIGYLGLISIFLKYIFSAVKTIRGKTIIFIMIALIFLINTIPLLNFDMKTTFTNDDFPEPYLKLNLLISSDKEYFRTLWVPLKSNFGHFDFFHPAVSMWQDIERFSDFSSLAPSASNFRNPTFYSDFFKSQNGTNLLKALNIKYIIIPLNVSEEIENIFPYAGDYNEYIKEFDSIPGINKLDISGINVYEVKNYKPLIYAMKENNTFSTNYETIEYKAINSGNYLLNSSLLNENVPSYLFFNENYNVGWKLCSIKRNIFDIMFKRESCLEEEYHFSSDLKLNVFYLKEGIKFSEDEELHLIFLPQIYLFLGIIISLLAATTSIFVLLFYTHNKKTRFKK